MEDMTIKTIEEVQFTPHQQELLKAFYEELSGIEQKYQAWFELKEQEAPGTESNKLHHYYIFGFSIHGTYFILPTMEIELPDQIKQECRTAYNKLATAGKQVNL